MFHSQVGFILDTQVWVNTDKLINASHHINRLNKKNHITVSIDTNKKAFDKIHNTFEKTQQTKNRWELTQLEKGYLPKVYRISYLMVRNLNLS